MTDFKDPNRRMPSEGQDAVGRFSIGNQDWQKRKSNGRTKVIGSPELLWQLACDYFQYCEENPIKKIDYKGAGVEQVSYWLPIAYTWDGLDDYLFSVGYCSTDAYKYNTEEKYNDYVEIIKQIEKVINNQKFLGAMAGMFNPMLTARALGLKEKVEQSGDKQNPVNVQHNFSSLGLDEQKQLLELLEKANAAK